MCFSYFPVRALGIAHLAGFVDALAGQAKVGRPQQLFPAGTIGVPRLRHFAPILRGVVFLGQTHFSAGREVRDIKPR
ncbi:hypothetical protein [Paracoccus sp. (in: a-proteobacteria)]|uniref:hypothetical protein n=1 Tax=Paracoccus sp. TaxID=267 RepID=UPI0032209168